MVLTSSNMLPLTTQAPDFELLDVTCNKRVSLNELKSPIATVIMFICNHCPYVKYIQEELVKVTNEYLEKGISFIAINSNDIENYPEDAPDKMREVALKFNYKFPYLLDETQEVAKAYKAACTPDFYIFDQNLKCVYRGQFDDARPSDKYATTEGDNKVKITGQDLKNALDNLLFGQPVNPEQKPSLGCNIKWK